MRIVNRKEFLSLPSGTLYTKASPADCMDLSDLCIKYDTLPTNDWVYAPLVDVYCNDCGERWDYQYKALQDSSYEIPLDVYATMRDGSYEEDRLFLVFSKEEVQDIVNVLRREVLGESL